MWTTVFKDLREEGYLREDIDIALCRVFVLGYINSVQTWFDPKKGSIERIVDQFITMFFEGAQPAAKPGRSSGKTVLAASS